MMDSEEDCFSPFLSLINNCDEDEPLLSESPLGDALKKIPLDRIPMNDLTKWTSCLNTEQLIPTNDGLRRDYRGLAELMGFKEHELDRFRRSYDPTKMLILNYMTKQSTLNIPSVTDFLRLLEKIERFDVQDDLIPTFVSLANRHDKFLKSNHQVIEIPPTGPTNELVVAQKRPSKLLTIHDKPGQELDIFDAFLCYAPEDFEYAQDLLAFLERNGLRVVTTDDLLPGMFEHDLVSEMIDSRCNKVIIIITPNFAKSKECEFQTKFASEVNFKSTRPKIIPIILEPYDDNELPSIIKVLSKLDLTNSKNRAWQLERLLRSLRNSSNAIVHRGETSGIQTAVKARTSSDASSTSRILINVEHGPIVELLDSKQSCQSDVNNPMGRPSSSKSKWWSPKRWGSRRSDSSSTSRMNLIADSRGDDRHVNYDDCSD